MNGAAGKRLGASANLTIDQATLTTPLRLTVAAALAFPDGSMTASGLRREHERGRLVVERIAGKLYTTLADIERMRRLCREERKAPDSGYENPGRLTEPGDALPGSFSMASGRSPQDALRQKLSAPNKCSPNTSGENTSRLAKRATSKVS